jgi:HEPN domain-containing protein
MRAETRNWIETAEYDLETARHLLATGRYPYVIFMCHLALEKMLKAHVSEMTGNIPPRTHDLIALTRRSGLDLPQGDLEFIGRINNVSIPTRYPDDLQRVLQEYTERVARRYLDQTEGTVRWLRQHPNLQT